MPIDDIAAEKAQRGEIEPEMLRDLGLAGGQSQAPGAQATRVARDVTGGSMPTQIQVPTDDAEFWVEVAILLVLIGIYLKL